MSNVLVVPRRRVAVGDGRPGRDSEVVEVGSGDAAWCSWRGGVGGS